MPQFNLCYVLRFQANGIAVAVTRKKIKHNNHKWVRTRLIHEKSETKGKPHGAEWRKKTPNQRKEKIICLITNWRTFVSKHIYIRWILWVVPLSTACSHIGHKLFTIKIYTHYIYIGFKAKERSQTCTSHDVTTTTTTEFVTFFLLSLKWLFFFYCRDCLYSFVFWILLFTILSLFEFNQMRIMWRKKIEH